MSWSPPPQKRSVFVSYHHGGDQGYYDAFARTFADTYEAIRDSSLDRRVDSSDSEYVMRRIREDYITGSSCTVVLCGAQTPARKFVDWEICATLNKEHGLIGVRLPTARLSPDSRVYVPDRLADNHQAGYALWVTWEDLARGGSNYLRQLVEDAASRSASLIRNGRSVMTRNA